MGSGDDVGGLLLVLFIIALVAFGTVALLSYIKDKKEQETYENYIKDKKKQEGR